jgi:hypothetical protein
MTAFGAGILSENKEAIMTKKYHVSLTDAERESLLTLTKKGSLAARKLTRAHILLQADAQATDDRIAQAPPRWNASASALSKAVLKLL